MRFVPFLVVLLLLSFASTEGFAETDKAQADFDVTGFSINPDLPKPEFCLTFNNPIQYKDRARVLSSITLYKDGKRSKISPDQLSVTPNDLCVQQLEHRSTYSLTIQRLQNANGKRLTRAYSNTFLMPDRKASLYFVEESRAQKMPRHVKETRKANDETHVIEQGGAHVLRSINVMATHLSLYRLADRESFPAAWQHFKINHVAPSESLSFARQKGQLVFESDLVFGDKPNEEQTLVAPLPHDEALLPGLYYLAATPRGKEGSDIALFAGQWFLVTDMQFTASRLGDGIVVFASVDDDKGKLPALDAEIAVLTPDGKVIVEGKTDKNGFVYLALDPEKMKSAGVVVGKAPNGNLSLLEAKNLYAEESRKDLTDKTAIHTNAAAYRFGESVGIFFQRSDINRLKSDSEETLIKLLRPDRRLYSEVLARFDNEKVSYNTIDLPLSGPRGKWNIVWDRKDGTRLGEAAIDVGIGPENAKIHVELDHSSLGKDTTLGATIFVKDDKGNPLPLENGALIISGAYPEIDGWKAYKFGDSTVVRDSQTKQIPFLTNEAGKAFIQITQKKLEELKLENIQGLSVSAALEQGISSQTVVIPVRTQETMVGIRMQPDDQPLPENGVATFEVVSIDMVGKRRAENNLHYVLYEEGRSFKWFPSEGHWDYKPLPTHRRVAGGAFDINGAGESLIRAPVRSGQYVLEIANAGGDVLARYGFEVGRRALIADKPSATSRLKVLKLPKEILVGGENKVTFNLEKAAMVSAIVWDGQIRQTINRFMNAGQNDITLDPAVSWGRRVQIQIQSLAIKSQKEEKQIYEIPVRLLEDELLVKATGPLKNTNDGQASIPVVVQKIAKPKTTKVMALTSFVGEGEQLELIPPVWGKMVELDAEGKGVVPVSLPAKTGKIRINLYAWNDAQFGTSVSMGEASASNVEASVPQTLTVGDKTSLVFTISNRTALPVAYEYQVEAKEGVVLSGETKAAIKLSGGSQKRIVINLLARAAGEGEVFLSLKGEGKESQKHVWPYQVRTDDQKVSEGYSQSMQKNQTYQLQTKSAALISPIDYPNAMTALRALIEMEPFTTEEVALWLEVMQEWHPLAFQLGVLSQANYNSLRSQRLLELRRRQNEDGGFSIHGGGGASDLISTAAALRLIHPSFERQSFFAIEWLMGRLQNTWFDESERNARAYAFQVLAKINKVDLSALRYFAETSKEKTLPVSVSAMLAIALVHAGDEAMAKPWISQVHQALSKAEGDTLESARALALLAFHETAQYEADRLEGTKPSIEGIAWSLMAMQRLSHRMKDWSVRIGQATGEHNGVWALAASQGGIELQNMSDAPLYVISEKESSGGNKGGLSLANAIHQATLYTSDGEIVEPGAVLSVGKTYLLSLYVSPKTAAVGPLRVLGSTASAYSIGIPARGRASVIQDVYPFLPQPITDMQKATQMVTGFGYELSFAKEWRSVVTVTPMIRGVFALPTIALRDDNGMFHQISDLPRFAVE